MGRPKGSQNKRPPKMCRAKSTNRAFVTVNRKPIYLGTWGSQEATERYAQVLSQLKFTVGFGTTADLAKDLTVRELVAAWWSQIQHRYEPDTLKCIRGACKILCEIAGNIPAGQLGPLKLREVRDAMPRLQIARGRTRKDGKQVCEGKLWTRTYCNGSLAWIKQMFAWGVSHEIIDATHLSAIRAVPPLQRNEKLADGFVVREGRFVEPVEEDVFWCVVRVAPPPVAAMLELQWITAARGGELCILRPIDIDMTRPDGIWVYKPTKHKGQRWGKDRMIYFGKRCQEIIRPFLAGRPVTDYIFRPADTYEAYDARRRAAWLTRRQIAEASWPAEVKRLGTKGCICPHCGKQYRNNKSPLAHHLIMTHSDHDLSRRLTVAIKREFADGINSKTRRARGRRGHQPRYSSRTYYVAVKEVCRKLKIPWFHPHQVRHAAATRYVSSHGWEPTRVLLGHSTQTMTERYAQPDQTKAEQIIADVG